MVRELLATQKIWKKIIFVTDSHVTCVLANRFSELQGESHVTCVLANRFSEFQRENKHYVLKLTKNDFGDKSIVFFLFFWTAETMCAYNLQQGLFFEHGVGSSFSEDYAHNINISRIL